MAKQSQQLPLMLAAMVLGVIAASKSRSGDAGQAMIMGSQAAFMQNQLSFSRDMEREADRVGFGVMTQAGYAPQGAAAMFEKLQYAARLNDNGSYPYLRSHPLNSERIADMQGRFQFKPGNAAALPLLMDHAMITARARVFTRPGVDVLRQWVDAAGASEFARASPAQQAGILYAAALSANELRDFKAAWTDYQATSAWYTQHFGLIPSDICVLPDGSPGATFFRLDLGDTPADHHTLAMAQSVVCRYGHSAFELVDPDAVGVGQQVLQNGGWQHSWGIGRHLLGSQIFDYWQDPWGNKHEHYCDGDLFTADVPTGVHAVSREAMAQWGPTMPRSFTKPSFTPASIVALFRNLRRSPDLTLSKLRTLAKIFA